MRTIAILLVLLLAGVSQGQTALSLAPNQVLSLPKGVHHFQRITFSYGSKLVVQPGSTIRIDPGNTISGPNYSLEAIGTQAEPIIFECSNPSQFWLGIFANNLSSTRPRNNLNLQYVTIRHVGRQASSSGISSCLSIEDRSDVLLKSCTLALIKQSGKPTQGVYCLGSSTAVTITDTLIDGGSLGLRQSRGAAFLLTNVLVTNCTVATQNENQASLLNGIID